MVRAVVRQVLPGLAVVGCQWVYRPALQEELLALPGLNRGPDRIEHRLVPDHAQVDQVAGFIVSVAGDVGRAMLVADLRDALRPQPVKLAADPLQPPGHERLAALRQGSVDLLEQVVGAFAYRNVAQDDLSILVS